MPFCYTIWQLLGARLRDYLFIHQTTFFEGSITVCSSAGLQKGPGTLPTLGQYLSGLGWLQSPELTLAQTPACELGAAVESGEGLGRETLR